MNGLAFRQHKIRRRRRKKKKTRSYGVLKAACGVFFVMVVLYFGAEYCGLFTRGQSPDDIPREVITRLDWQSGFPAAEEAVTGQTVDGNIVNRVTGWISSYLGGTETTDSAPTLDPNPGNTHSGVLIQSPPQVSVYIANGCGVNKFAARFRQELRDAGFDVVGASNADASDYSQTLIVDRSGISAKAEEVCSYFQARWGVGRIIHQKRDAPLTDVLVVLGKDLSHKVDVESVEP